ncbi:hypothetical protein GWI33_004065 [Rhynchophorus ferrugineus]|uniref:Uncharacterized protein n=1 Tax=Rhynchophorus ferrugineus TaxID=354439 RepID=A0A834IJ83_RHYFE|nr:hypothetical protein GWI33_004065 [Rhynchophorus ferrugineus]
MQLPELKNYEFNEKVPDEKAATFKENALKYFRVYCSNTSIHGLQYLGGARCIWERIWWLISIILSLSLFVTLVVQTFHKWQVSPIMVTFATKETPTWQVPFPAVTICPLTKSVSSKFNFTHHIKRLNANETLDTETEKKLGYLSLICNMDARWVSQSDSEFADYHLFEFLNDVQPNFDEMLSHCMFMGKPYSCSDLFFPVITDEGLCYTFNLLDRSQLYRDDVVFTGNLNRAPKLSNWTLEHGYDINDEINTYPFRALFSGSIFALQGILTSYHDEEGLLCREGVRGFKMQISNPSVMPRPLQQHLLIPMNRMVECASNLNIIGTSETVKKYDPSKRNCYYTSERYLNYFKLYSQENCQIECRTNFSIAICGCIDFYMPRYNDTPICRRSNLVCLFNAQETLLNTIIDRQLARLRGTDNHSSDIIDNCDCLPICTSMAYTVETTQTHWDWENLLPPPNSSRKLSRSAFQVYMKSSQFMSSERNELFGITDFLANFGGLLGLFIGFSLLSLIEIIYYLSLRIIVNIKHYNKWFGEG